MRDRGLTVDPVGVNADGELIESVAMGRLSTVRVYAGAVVVMAGIALLKWGCAVVPEFAREETRAAVRRNVNDEEEDVD